MNEQIKNKLYDLFYWELKDKIEYDKYFHVDVELVDQNKTYTLVSTLYAEGGEEIYTDYDQPREFKNPCISCSTWGLVSIDEESDVSYYDTEAEEIILQAINNYRV